MRATDAALHLFLRFVRNVTILAKAIRHLHTSRVIRPCFLVIDHEFPDSISTRKLVLETAKYNVITAYSAKEAVATFRLFPNVSGIVMNEAVTDTDCASLVNELRAIRPNVLMIVTSSRGPTDCVVADHQLNNFDPAALLNLLRKLVPNPLEHYLSE
jgi:CheY-like chemotaxis protein